MDRILIVEDNPVLLKILQSGMRKYENRFVTLTAKDGEEAIEILQNDAISLLVTDLQMPKVDGLTLLAYMNEHHPEIPCVVMSAHGTPQIKERISRDVLRFIEKPFEIEELVETILPALESDQPGGTLNGISISNFLQMIYMEQKTCLLEIEIPDGRTGYFYFEEGALFDAIFDDLQGEEAALALIPNERAKIRFKNLSKGREKVTRKIEKDLMALLMDAMRLKDEMDFEDESIIEEEEIEAADFSTESQEAEPEDVEDEWTELEHVEDQGHESEDIEGQGTGPEFDYQQTAPEDVDSQWSEPAEIENIEKKKEFDGLDSEIEESFSALVEPEPLPESPPALSEEAPAHAPTGGVHSAPDEAASALTGLRGVTGYRGSAVVDLAGEVLFQDTAVPGLDLELVAAVAIDMVRAAQKVTKETGLGSERELLLSADGGILLCAPSNQEDFYVVVLLGADGNRALARIALKKIIPALEEALG